MPFLTADVTTEHDGLAVFTQQQVHQVATTLQGLSREQLSTRSTVSEFSPGTLARHVLAVVTDAALDIRAAAAAASGQAAEPEATRPADGSTALSGAGGEELLPSDTAESLERALESAGAELATAIREGDLEASVPVPEAPWFTGEERWTVRWIALHCLEEVARHAGHADILRESIDGQFAYALNTIADGEPWPPANW